MYSALNITVEGFIPFCDWSNQNSTHPLFWPLFIRVLPHVTPFASPCKVKNSLSCWLFIWNTLLLANLLFPLSFIVLLFPAKDAEKSVNSAHASASIFSVCLCIISFGYFFVFSSADTVLHVKKQIPGLGFPLPSVPFTKRLFYIELFFSADVWFARFFGGAFCCQTRSAPWGFFNRAIGESHGDRSGYVVHCFPSRRWVIGSNCVLFSTFLCIGAEFNGAAMGPAGVLCLSHCPSMGWAAALAMLHHVLR